MHSRSAAVKRIASVVKRALLTMLRWVSVAPLGAPVVPLVNWMLIGSPGSSVAPISSTIFRAAGPAMPATSPKLTMPGDVASPIRITVRRWGSFSDRSLPGSASASSGASVCNISR